MEIPTNLWRLRLQSASSFHFAAPAVKYPGSPYKGAPWQQPWPFRQDFKCRRGVIPDLPLPFFGFCVCFLRFGVSNFLKGTELSEVQNFWHPARFRILRRRISIRDSDFGKLPDSYPTRVGFACGTREFRAAHGQLGWALCSVCDASGCLCWHILFCVTEGQKFSFGWNGCLLAHTVLLKELRSVICDVNQCCSASFPLLISLKGC